MMGGVHMIHCTCHSVHQPYLNDDVADTRTIQPQDNTWIRTLAAMIALQVAKLFRGDKPTA